MNDSNNGNRPQTTGSALDAMSAGISPVLRVAGIVLAVIGGITVLGLVGMVVMHFGMMGGIGRMGVC